MKRHILIPSLAALSLTGLGCSFAPDYSGLDEGLACGLEGLTASLSGILDQPREGEIGTAELHGLCSLLEECHDGSPLLLGADHDVWVTATSPPDGGSDLDAQIDVASSEPARLACSVVDAGCATASGALEARAAGEAEVTVFRDGAPIDHFLLAVAEADSAMLEALAAEAEPRELTLRVGEAHWLRVTVRDSNDTALAVGDGAEWQLADDGRLAFTDAEGTPTGELDDATRDALLEAHGS
jgi:hypothetical protein